MNRDDAFRMFSVETGDAVVAVLITAVLSWAGTTEVGQFLGRFL